MGCADLLGVETHGQVVEDTLYLQFGWGGGMNARELDFSLDLDLTGLAGREDEDGCSAPFYGTRIGTDAGIANDFTLALDGEADVLLGQTAYVT